MKKVKQLVLLFSLVLILFSSCQKSTPPQLAAIPNNASFVVALENKQIVKKGGLDKLNDFKCYEKLSKELVGDNENIGKFLKDPNATGLDMDQVYIFGVLTGEKMYASASFKMKDLKAFEANISELAKTKEGDAKPQIEDKKTYKIINQDTKCAFVWNNNLFFLFLGDLETLKYEEFFAMPKEKSIVSLDNFKEFQKHDYDIGFWMSYSAVGDIYSKFLGLKMPMVEDMAGIYMHSYIEFKKDEIKGTAIMSPKAKVDEYYAKYPVWKDGFDAKLLQDYPENSYMALKASVNVLEYYKLIQNTMKGLGNNSQMSTVAIDDVMNNPMINTVCSALSGDMLLNIYGFAKGPFPIPLAGLTFGVKSEEDFQKLLALAPQQMIQKNDDYYVVSTGAMVSVYIGYKDKRVFVTDDADAISAFAKSTSAKSLESTSLGKSMKDNSIVFYLNLNIDSYPENIQSLLKSDGLFGNMQSYVSFLSIFKDFTVISKSKYETEGILKMKSGKENSLKQLLQKIDEFAAATIQDEQEEIIMEEEVVVEEPVIEEPVAAVSAK